MAAVTTTAVAAAITTTTTAAADADLSYPVIKKALYFGTELTAAHDIVPPYISKKAITLPHGNVMAYYSGKIHRLDRTIPNRPPYAMLRSQMAMIAGAIMAYTMIRDFSSL